MSARIHHLNCGTMCPYGARLITGERGFGKAEIVCHCLLIETTDSLVLIDTGLGLEDVRHPHRRLGIPLTVAFGVAADPAETAIEQLRGLGHDPADVRQIALTHLDLDHAGGLPDFPAADVHVFEAERAAALKPSLRERARYASCQLAHGPRWVVHEADGDSWFGFESIRLLPGVDPEVLLIPLPGHSRGHTAVAVSDGEGWILHCGDAYYHHGEVAMPPSCPPVLRHFETLTAADNTARKRNLERLRELAREHGDEVRLFCAHDAVELAREQSR